MNRDMLNALREACRLAWEQQNEVLMDRRLSVAAREQVKADAEATMRAWEGLRQYEDEHH